MAGRHLSFSFNLEDLKAEQVDIDKLIDSLLSKNNSTAISSSAPALQQRRDSETATTPTSVPTNGRGPGRPRVAKSTTTRPPTSPSPVLADSSPLSTVIACLNKINVQNKRLLDIVETISDKIESVNVNNSMSNNVVSDMVVDAATSVPLSNVNSRLEKIEQNINQTTLFCRGPAVESLIKDSSTSERLSLERLKGDICKRACGEEITSVDISGVRVSVFGKAKKAIKVECPNISSKLHLIRRARERRPQGFYISEFLTESKLKLFHSVRALKKLHPQKIKAVFTRGGNVFYSLVGSDRYFQVTSIGDLNTVLGLDASGGTTRAV